MSCHIQNCVSTIPPCSCTRCQNGFTPSKDQSVCVQNAFCQTCFNARRVCDPSGAFKCNECSGQPSEDGMQCLDNTVCASCTRLERCTSMNGELSCTPCSSGQISSFDKQTCISAKQCTTCPPNTHCVQVVSETSFSATTTCRYCADNMPSSEDRLYCFKKAACEVCAARGEVCTPEGACQACPIGTVPSDDSTVCITAPPCDMIFGCLRCENNDSTACAACAPGMAVVSGGCGPATSCSHVDNCLICEGYNCEVCQKGFKSEYGRCYQILCDSSEECPDIVVNSISCSISEGKFQCVCKYGEWLSDDKKICLNKDICYDCTRSKQLCKVNAGVTAFECQDCPEGTSFLGEECVPSCVGCAEDEFCGYSYSARKFECQKCPDGQRINPSKTGCAQSSCVEDCTPVHPDFACVFDGKSFECTCPDGGKLDRGSGKCVADGCRNCNSYQDVCILGADGFSCYCSNENYRYDAQQGCVPDCAGDSAKFCSFRGKCNDRSECVCTGHFAGRNCEGCAAGHDLHAGVCMASTCLGEAHCNGNGYCQLGLCNCLPGHGGTNCEVCPTGARFDGARCVSNSCGLGRQCDGHGRCQDDICQCDALYEGWNCGKCQDGVLRNFAGECLPDGAGDGAVVKSGAGMEIAGISLAVLCGALLVVVVVVAVKCSARKRQSEPWK
ncbi:Cysteine-rich membrane protein 2 [Spironucleus salmonicida]|uniref:Cysteine-rich membrane protein 2 n=1 Tax=Spironucleus salmonicida TaxID=348837 RepID=A0A9P8LTY3_9EUKA|nr:Cysteine-rich membrane protein 2 [Spironucleus salmonicida]